MCAVGSVDDRRQTMGFGQCEHFRALPGDAVIGGMHQHKMAAIGMSSARSLQILRRNAEGDPQPIVKTHRQRQRRRAGEHQPFVNAVVRVSRHKNLAPAAKREQRRLESQRGATEKILNMGTAARSRPGSHRFCKHALGMGEVVKAGDLCEIVAENIAAPGCGERLRHDPPVFMTRCVKACCAATDGSL